MSGVIYAIMLVNSGMYSILMVRFSFVIYVENLKPVGTQHLSGGNHILLLSG
jgi:hypothetical protein